MALRNSEVNVARKSYDCKTFLLNSIDTCNLKIAAQDNTTTLFRLNLNSSFHVVPSKFRRLSPIAYLRVNMSSFITKPCFQFTRRTNPRVHNCGPDGTAQSVFFTLAKFSTLAAPFNTKCKDYLRSGLEGREHCFEDCMSRRKSKSVCYEFCTAVGCYEESLLTHYREPSLVERENWRQHTFIHQAIAMPLHYVMRPQMEIIYLIVFVANSVSSWYGLSVTLVLLQSIRVIALPAALISRNL